MIQMHGLKQNEKPSQIMTKDMIFGHSLKIGNV